MPRSATHLDSLDAVRGAAIIMVVAFHLWFSWIQLLGDAGVDLFFVLSGYLIGGILLDHRGYHRYYQTFYARRAFRILPLYILLLLAGGLPAHGSVWWFLTFTQNVSWAAMHWFPAGTPASVTWSLAVEEQFYLLLPVLVRVLPRRALESVLWIGVIAAPLSRWGVWHAGVHDAFLLLPCRFDGLMGGALIACLERSDASARLWWLPLALVGPLIDRVLHRLDPGFQVANLSGLSLVFSAIVLLAIRFRRPFPRILRPICWIGTGAYFIYLFHLLIYQLCGDSRLLMLPAVGVLAWASWEFLERPLTGFARNRWRYGDARRRQPGMPAAAISPQR